MTVMLASVGEWSGNVRSTPMPSEILRTVNVLRMPAPRTFKETQQKFRGLVTTVHGEGLAHAGTAHVRDETAELLLALLVTLDHAHHDLDRVTRSQVRTLGLDLGVLDFLQQAHRGLLSTRDGPRGAGIFKQRRSIRERSGAGQEHCWNPFRGRKATNSPANHEIRGVDRGRTGPAGNPALPTTYRVPPVPGGPSRATFTRRGQGRV